MFQQTLDPVADSLALSALVGSIPLLTLFLLLGGLKMKAWLAGVISLAVSIVLAGFGELVPGSVRGVSVRLAAGEAGLADVVRALDSDGLRVAHLQLHAPTLDDVFLEKTGRSLEGAGEEVAAPRLPARALLCPVAAPSGQPPRAPSPRGPTE